MTDKKIFEKLEAEIERLENYKNESVTSSDIRFGWIHGKTFALTSIRVLLDSMQKEPKECMYSKDNYTAEDRKVLCEGCNEECEFNKKEEPVSEDLKEAYERYVDERMVLLRPDIADMSCDRDTKMSFDVFDGSEAEAAFYEGAQWQKHKDANLIFNAKEDGYRLGLATMKQQMMAKAVDATVHIDAGGYPYIPQMELYDYEKDIPLAREGDKYKVVLIKES